jgi:cysteinyl-tRNA synthetase
MPDNPLLDIQTWLYHLGDASSDNTEDIADGGYDLIVLEWASYANEEAPYTPAQLDTMRGSEDSLIVSYLSIGEAESYRYYWDTDEFQAVKNAFLDEENPEWEENFKVQYWNEHWQSFIFDYLERIIDGGFNGVYLDIIDAFEYWEEEDPNNDIDYKQEMANFVAAIRAHAEAYLGELGDDRTFVIIGQNGESLLENQTYLDAIDGVGKEDLQFYYENGNASDFTVQSDDDVNWSMDLLQLALDAGKQVMVVEYLDDNRQAQHNGTLSDHADKLWELGIPLYISGNRDLDAVFTQPNSVQYVRLMEGSGSDEIFRGTAFGDVIAASGGDDQIWAGPSDYSSDVFVGGGGNDTIGGGEGNDLLVGGGAIDGDNAQLFDFTGNASNDGTDRLFGSIGNDTLVGGSWNDGLVDDNGLFDLGEAVTTGGDANRLWAGAGDDLIIGAAGGDTIGGSSGNDDIFGEGGDDRVFAASGDDSLSGGDGNDTLFSGAGADTVDGGAGNDLIWAGGGIDLFTGDAGADTFAFSANSGQDTITDFDLAEDILRFASESIGFSTVDDVAAAATEDTQNDQAGLLINLSDGNSVFLIGISLTDISSIIFEF